MQAKRQHLVHFYIWTHLSNYVWAVRLGWKGEEINVYLISGKPWNVRGWKRCIGRKKMQWKLILEFASVPSHLKNSFLCCVLAPQAVPLWRGTWQSEHRLGVCAGLTVPSRVSHGIGPILKAIWMAQMDLLPGEVWEKSAAGYLFCLQGILISCMEVYFIIFSWTVK